MWLLEHGKQPLPILHAAHRVLRSGGTICLTETDYTTFKVQPGSPDWDELERAQYDYFATHGLPIAGQQLGNLLCRAGFHDVRSGPVGFHFFRGDDPAALQANVDYIAAFLEPTLADLAAATGRDESRLRAGIAHLRAVPAHEDGSTTQIVYRAHGRKQ